MTILPYTIDIQFRTTDMNVGALPAETLRDIISAGFIQSAKMDNIRPGSLDLSLSSEIYRLDGIILPRPFETIRDILPLLRARPHSFDYPLERNGMYIVRLEESLHLPQGVSGACNPRSSTGRNDILVRVIGDRIGRFDSIPSNGYNGELWIVISPKSYPILLKAGETLTQLRLFTNTHKLSELELLITNQKEKLIWDLEGRSQITHSDFIYHDYDGSILLSAHLQGDIIGWECLGSNRVMDFTKNQFHKPEDFFSPIYQTNNALTLKSGGFYILKTKESVRVPKNLACEMVPTDERSGEFRTHYAGFIDPGWGYGIGGEGVGRSLVLEIRPFEDIIIRDGQPVAKILFEPMTKEPFQGYDELSLSNYANNFSTPKLSRHFIQ